MSASSFNGFKIEDVNVDAIITNVLKRNGAPLWDDDLRQKMRLGAWRGYQKYLSIPTPPRGITAYILRGVEWGFYDSAATRKETSVEISSSDHMDMWQDNSGRSPDDHVLCHQLVKKAGLLPREKAVIKDVLNEVTFKVHAQKTHVTKQIVHQRWLTGLKKLRTVAQKDLTLSSTHGRI